MLPRGDAVGRVQTVRVEATSAGRGEVVAASPSVGVKVLLLMLLMLLMLAKMLLLMMTRPTEGPNILMIFL